MRVRPSVARRLDEARSAGEVAVEFMTATGISIGVPKQSGEVIDFLDNDAWDGRAEDLVRCLDRDAIGGLVSLIIEDVTRRPAHSDGTTVIARPFVDDRRDAAVRLDKARRAAAEALEARRTKDQLDPEEAAALVAVAEMAPKAARTERGRPQVPHVSALWVLMSILNGLKRADGMPLTDADMARLLCLVCPVLLRLPHRDVMEKVRKNRKALRIRVACTPDAQKVLVFRPERCRSDGKHDHVGLTQMFPGYEIEYLPAPALPPEWRKARKKPAVKMVQERK